jgi:CheY-like chemotaxis protein
MGLQCLLVTADANLLSHVRTSLAEHGTSIDLRQDSTSAIELASRRHWDGVVIDCDDVSGGVHAVTQVRNSRSNKQTMILAVVNGATSAEAAIDLGANFVLSKPIHDARLRGILEVAIPKMQREHRRYFRYDVSLPVRLRSHDGQVFSAKMRNASEGGLALRLTDPVRLEGVVNVEFDLPSVLPRPFQAKADVVWTDSFAMGLRFLYVEKDAGLALQGWLDSLESQLQFRNSISGSGAAN